MNSLAVTHISDAAVSIVPDAIAAGERTIPGLRIWEETVSGVRV